VRFSLWTSTGRPWEEILAAARTAAEAGCHGVWVPDHFMPPEAGYGTAASGADPERMPVHEAWTTLAALAGLVPRVRLGVLVSGNTYRHPAVLAKMASTVDHISGGRLILGLGASWQENEHRRYGIDYGTAADRSDRLDEAAAMITGLLSQDRTTHHGAHYRLEAAPLEPKPLQARLPLLIGGGGERRTLRTAARYATAWNVWGLPPTLARKGAILDAYCREVGREPAAVEHTVAAFLDIRDDPDEAARTRERFGEKGGLVGTPAELRTVVADYAAAGVSELIIPDYNHTPATRATALARFRDEVLSG
jgi:F420-dependent oxidoreductase-like protein